MTIRSYDTISSVNASSHFTRKLSKPVITSDSCEFTAALRKQIASIETAILAAQTADAQSHTPDFISGTTTPAADKIPTATSSTDVCNEGKLRCSDELNAYFKEAAETYQVDVKLLKSVAYVESSFRTGVTSKCGAMGVMQLMPSTAKHFGVQDAYDPYQNIMAGANLLSTLLKRYDGDVELALAAYNAGSGNVKKAHGVPEYTRGYIKKVLNCYNSTLTQEQR